MASNLMVVQDCLFAFLPLAAFLAIFRAFRLRGEGRRAGALGAATVWGVLLVLITECLSVPRLIARPALALSWSAVTLGFLFYDWLLKRRASESQQLKTTSETSGKDFSSFDWIAVGGAAILLGLIGLTAILSAPNTWDAMAYHMSRVAQWMTNRDVNLYRAFYSAQLFLSPWAEYAILHLDVLYGGDRLVNLVEFLSMTGTLVGVSLIAAQLGAGRRGQLLAAIACATLPEGVLEASGAMNTYVGAFWIVVAVYYLLRWRDEQSPVVTLALGSSAGLAIFTKGTAYLFLPCIFLACWWIGGARARKLLLVRLPILLLVVLVLNGPLFVRNYQLSGSPLGFSTPLGNDPERQYSNSHVSPSVMFASGIKNLALHVGTPVDGVNRWISSVISGTFQILGIDPNDKASTYRGGFHLNGPSSHEARAGNPVQLALIGIAAVLLFSKRFGDKATRWYAIGLVGSFLLFCAMIRWQPWNSRYHLPLFALGLAMAAVVIERSWPRIAIGVLACLLVLCAMPFALMNSIRPLAPWMPTSILREPRMNSYFADSHRWLIHSYTSAAEFVEASHCDSIGIDSSLEDFDYPMFVLLDAGRGERQVRYAEVRNLTSAYARPGSKAPCAVICLRCANASAKWAEYKQVGGRASVFDEVAVFSENGNVANTQDFVSPTPLQAEQILKALDDYRESPRGVSFAATEASVRNAGRDWPSKRADLKDRLDALYTNSLTLWRVRDSVDPLRRRGEPIDDLKIDPVQLMAASQVFTNWNQMLPERVAEVNGLVDQLYSSWETKATPVALPTGQQSGCRVGLKTETHSRNPASGSRTTTAVEQTVDFSECSCLPKQSNGEVLLARKSFGEYDSEAENLSKCMSAAFRVPFAAAPVHNPQIAAITR